MLCRNNSIRRSGSVPVYLSVYDLTSINGYAYWLGLGVYHSGVQVHGVEYAFGSHEYPTTGIFEAEPKVCDGFRFRKSILIGWTELSPIEVRRAMEEFTEEYKGDAYNLVTKNCNHFCDDACIRLTGKSIPSWVNRLARIGSFCNCILPVRLNSTKVGHHKSEDKICYEEKRKLESRSNRFNSSSNSTSSSSLSPPVSRTRSSSSGRSLPPSAPLILDSSSSS